MEVAVLRWPNFESQVSMRKFFLGGIGDIDGSFRFDVIFQTSKHIAHAWAVEALHDNWNKVVEECVYHIHPSQRLTVPQEKEKSWDDHYPMADFSPNTLLQPSVEVSWIG